MLSLPTKEWWLGFWPMEDMECCFQRLHRLNQGLDTGHWRVYEHREEPNAVCLVLSIDSSSVTVLKGMGWRQFSGMGQAIFSLLGV